MIFDYSNYTNNYQAYGLNIYEHPQKKNLFNKNKYICPICNICISEATISKSNIDTTTMNFADTTIHQAENVYVCTHCGWWEHSYYQYFEGEPLYKDWTISANTSILRKFNLEDKSIPINILRKYITDNIDKIYKIHDKKMEELVASVFREHYNCEAIVVGKSNDGGIDIILITFDNSQIVIQVKRRKTPKKTEFVKEIRELIGATILSSSKNCIFVSTADHFSKESIKTVNKALQKNIVDSFELFDIHSFSKLLNLYKKNSDLPYWERLLNLR